MREGLVFYLATSGEFSSPENTNDSAGLDIQGRKGLKASYKATFVRPPPIPAQHYGHLVVPRIYNYRDLHENRICRWI